MTDTAAVSTPAPAQKPASFWEDLIDIFFQPADVFRRRENASFWPPLAVVAVLMAVFAVANTNVLQPIIDAETSRQMALMMKSNPQFTPEMAERGRALAGRIQQVVRYGTIVTIPILLFLYGLWAWLSGKLFGSKQTFGAAMMVISYSFIPRVLESVVFAVQGLLMDPSNLNALTRIRMSPARFYDPDSANPMMLAILSRLDLFVIWFWILVGVGLYVTGKVSRGKAAAFSFTMWALGSMWAIRSAYMLM
jgi:hypothetical protein